MTKTHASNTKACSDRSLLVAEHSQEAAFHELVHEVHTLKVEKEALGLQIQRTKSWAKKHEVDGCPVMDDAVVARR